MSEFKDWYYSIPFFTRWWLSLTVFFSLFERFRLFKYEYLILAWTPFINYCQIWRPFTALFFYPITPSTGFHFLVNCYFLYSYSKRLEIGAFAGKPADYCYMLLFNLFCCVVLGFLFGIMILMDSMVLSVLYVWCQLNKDVVVTFWFGTRFKAMYLPWVLLGFNVIVNHGGLPEFVGVLVGHLAFFLLFKYPQEFGGPQLLSPPDFLKRIFPDRRNIASFGVPPESRAPMRAGGIAGHDWGRGHTLGGN